MRNTLAVLLVLIVSVSFGSVRSGSYYTSAARDLSDALVSVGVYAQCSIEYELDGYQYVIRFDGDYYDESDIAEVFCCAMAVGLVSSSTSWTSMGMVCVYEDKVIVMDTAACRQMNSYINGGYSDTVVYNFYLSNSYVYDRTGEVRSMFPL